MANPFLQVNKGYHILLMFISPFWGLIQLFKMKNKAYIIYMGTLFFGILGSLYVYTPGNDGHTHLKNIENNYLDMGLSTFFRDLINLLIYNTSNTSTSDPYLHIIGFFSGSFFQMPELLHVFASLMYGAIYFRCLMFIFDGIKIKKVAIYILLLISIFLIYRGVTGLNSIRWWTAFWLMFLGLLGYSKTLEKKYIVLIILSVYIHFSFMVFIIPIFLSYFLKKRIGLVFLIWLVSFAMSTSYNFIKPYIPDIQLVQEKEKYTLNTEILERSQAAKSKPTSSKNFYAEYGEVSYRDFSIVLLTGLLFYFVFKTKNDLQPFFYFLFTAGVLLYSFANFMEFSPAVSGRGKAGASVILLASAIILIANNYNQIKFKSPKFFKLGLKVFIVSTIPMVLFQLSYFLNIFSAFSVAFPFISWFIGSDDFTMKELIDIII